MTRASLVTLSAALALLTGCGAQTPVVHSIPGNDVTVSVDSSTARFGSLLAINQSIDMYALGRRGLALWLVPAIGG